MLLLSHYLIDYLSAEAVEHGKAVADFTHSLAVYEDFKPDQVEDEKTGLAYDKAVESMKEWLRKAMLVYMAEAHTYTQSSVNLILPSGELSLEVLADTAKSQQYGGYYEEAEMVMTPIGYMNYAVYSLIKDVKDNPVRMFYKHLAKCVKNMHHILIMKGADELFLSKDLLKDNSIQDPLDIQRIAFLMEAVPQFFDETV